LQNKLTQYFKLLLPHPPAEALFFDCPPHTYSLIFFHVFPVLPYSRVHGSQFAPGIAGVDTYVKHY